MSQTGHRKMTQRRIAEIAGVSQATVSLVLNGKADDASARIPDETRQRVLDVIRETTYVADPAARRLAGVGNKILGVFTYEPAFPSSHQDFYAPLLRGIEARAEELGFDLLLFTSAPVRDGRRTLFNENNRLQLADGCLLLGLEMDPDELTRLLDTGFPFVAVGRREVADVPYVGIDYAAGTAQLVQQALALGHRRFFYLHRPSSGEAVLDRQAGFLAPLAADTRVVGQMSAVDVDGHTGSPGADDLVNAWRRVREFAPTVLFVESANDAAALLGLATADGISVPRDLSIVVLGEPQTPAPDDLDFTCLVPPRTELAAACVSLLGRLLSTDDQPSARELRTLLECELRDGDTLVSPAAEAAR